MPTLFTTYQFDIRVRFFNTPRGIRIPVASVKGMCPRPLDDGGLVTTQRARPLLRYKNTRVMSTVRSKLLEEKVVR